MMPMLQVEVPVYKDGVARFLQAACGCLRCSFATALEQIKVVVERMGNFVRHVLR